MVINAEQRPCECQYLAESDEHGVVDFAGWRNDEPCHQQTAAHHNQEYGGEQLEGVPVFLGPGYFSEILRQISKK